VSRVSCVIPTHGRPGLLPGAIESVQAQTHDDVEILVVLDESADETAEIVAEFAAADDRIVPVETTAETPWAARNDGIDAATGEYLAFLDDDDRWDPAKLETQLPYADDYSLVSCSCHFVRPDETVEKTLSFTGVDEMEFEDVFRSIRNLYPSGTLARTAAVRAIGGFDDHIEWDFYLRMVDAHGPAAVLSEPLVYFNREDIDRVSDANHCDALLAVYERHRDRVSWRIRRHRLGRIYSDCYDEEAATANGLAALARVAYYSPDLFVPAIRRRLVGILAALRLKEPIKRLIRR
jgi:glycosyltransferase involved in cell wall biosynthesis